MLDLGGGLDASGLEHLDLLLCGGEGGAGLQQTGVALHQKRGGLLGPTASFRRLSWTARRTAGMILLGETQFRVGRCDLLTRLFDHRGLQRQLGIDGANFALGRLRGRRLPDAAPCWKSWSSIRASTWPALTGWLSATRTWLT